MSALSDFINLLRLDVNIYHNAKVCGNWEIREHTLGATCFHLVTMGRCHLNVPGYIETEFNQGDLVIFPRELKHHMRSLDNSDKPQQHLDYHSSITGTGMLCGEVSLLHRYRNQLLDALPPVIFIKNSKDTPWLNMLTQLMLAESIQPDAEQGITLNRLSELLFIYALRHHLQEQIASARQEPGILALYADQKLALAVKAFHAKPQHRWDIESLATTAGMSRTLFANRFKQASGWTVNQYTSWWRMQLAWEALRQGQKVYVVAEQIGYLSEAAFSRAFRKHFGLSAGRVRREQLDRVPEP